MKYKYSGHETFPCRYSWLPKAVNAVRHDPRIFSDEDNAMVVMGVGKNMVRAIRFWAEVSGVIKSATHGYSITDFGKNLLGPRGTDPYLEDIQTLWLIHWNISTQFESPLFAWHFLFNKWQEPEITRTAVLKAFLKEANQKDESRSLRTLENHFDVFIHTYVPTQTFKSMVLEDNLDCPLTELDLVQVIGETTINDRRETVYAFRRDEKPEISPELFAYCVYDYFMKKHPTEKTLPLREIAIGSGSPGQVFKLPESDIRERLDGLKKYTNGILEYKESASLPQIHRSSTQNVPIKSFLRSIFEGKPIHG
ncbi:MAG TPA: DUF4007 family protein [Anaerohalosphaeraceae bacterium]|nr:DUF4007 family protein [Anaerohalosphaeraceae bacterium]